MKKLLLLFLTLLGAPAMSEPAVPAPALATASFGGGCFWCVEPFFEQLKGVHSAVSGYQGGTIANPTYEEVTSGRTGHAEVVQVVYDPAIVSFETLLTVFFAIHDPTTLNQQGADKGTQYRSIILAPDEARAEEARTFIAALTADKAFPKPIVTEVKVAGPFYKAEGYHQDYFKRNPNAAYCRLVIAPKMKKVQINEAWLK